VLAGSAPSGRRPGASYCRRFIAGDFSASCFFFAQQLRKRIKVPVGLVTAGLAWLVVVAAEMIAGRDGLGFAVWDARNGLRIDLLGAAMVAIGVIGVALDRVLVQLTRIPSVRWGYER
jgi:hypothetical protein